METPGGGKPGADVRDYLAGERTFLGWIRTGLALMGFGFVVARFGLFLAEIRVARTDRRFGSSASAARPRRVSIDSPSVRRMSSWAIVSSCPARGGHSSSLPPAAWSSSADATPPAAVENAATIPDSL